MGLPAAKGIAGTYSKESRLVTAEAKTLGTAYFDSSDFERFRPRLREGADLSRTNWFRVGGRAEWLFKPEDTADLAGFLALLPVEVVVTVLGVGSNVIVRDGGINGVVVKLGRGFADITVDGMHIMAGAAALDVNVARVAGEYGITGFEFLSGIPGTIGGAVRMNGGAYGTDISALLAKAEVVQRQGAVHVLPVEQIGFSYRHSLLPEDAIVTRAWLQCRLGDKHAIMTKMQEIQAARESTQPVRSRTGGSTFKNPEGHKAWELIDQAGCRGLCMGGAMVSDLHCNFLINQGNATAADLEALGEEVRARVLTITGINLEWEIKRIGKFASL